jgi:hypothetical protein
MHQEEILLKFFEKNDKSNVVDPFNFGTGTTDKSFFVAYYLSIRSYIYIILQG